MLAGRIIGAIGAACASALWGVLLLVTIAFLITPKKGWEGLALLALIPLAPLVCMMFVASVIDLVVLIRRADRGNPWRIAATHVVLGGVAAWSGAWPAAALCAGIAGTQMIALRLFGQITPSHASSHR